jgi:putative hemin transport protein
LELLNDKKIIKMDTITDNRSAALREAWQRIQASSPGIRIREAAKELGSSEAQLLATGIGEEVVRLQGPWTELLRQFKTLGRVMSLTRNDSCILEHKGTFDEIDIMDRGAHAMATVIGPIETRVFFQAWHVAFAVTEAKGDRVLKSIQVFDSSGTAVTKIYLQEKSDVSAFERIIQDFSSPDQSPLIETSRYERHSYSDDVNQELLLDEWAHLKDTHDFFGLLRKYNVQRHQAMELGEHRFTTRVDPIEAPFQILQQASQSRLPIMIFAGNRGNLQIHQGTVRTIRVLERGHTGPERWLNVLDPDFNMHLKQNDIATAWLVKKPTSDGDVTSVELYDHHQELVVQFFGLRKPGLPEREEWRILLDDLVSKK